jgi:hypothetical protein
MGAYNPTIDNPLQDLANSARNTLSDVTSQTSTFMKRTGVSALNSAKGFAASMLGDKTIGAGTIQAQNIAGVGGEEQAGPQSAVTSKAQQAASIAADRLKAAATSAIKKFIIANIVPIGIAVGVIVGVIMILFLVLWAKKYFENHPLQSFWECVLVERFDEGNCAEFVAEQGVESIQEGFSPDASLQKGNF